MGKLIVFVIVVLLVACGWFIGWTVENDRKCFMMNGVQSVPGECWIYGGQDDRRIVKL